MAVKQLVTESELKQAEEIADNLHGEMVKAEREYVKAVLNHFNLTNKYFRQCINFQGKVVNDNGEYAK
jgi:hypothetical protein